MPREKKTLGQFAFEADRRNSDETWDDADIYTRKAYSIMAETMAKVSVMRYKDKLVKEVFPRGRIHNILIDTIIPKSSIHKYEKDEDPTSLEGPVEEVPE